MIHHSNSLIHFLAVVFVLQHPDVPHLYFHAYGRSSSTASWKRLSHLHGRWSTVKFMELLHQLESEALIQFTQDRRALQLTSAGVEVAKPNLTKNNVMREAFKVLVSHISYMDHNYLAEDKRAQFMLSLEHLREQAILREGKHGFVNLAGTTEHALICAQFYWNSVFYKDSELFFLRSIHLGKASLQETHLKVAFAVQRLVEMYTKQQLFTKAEKLLDEMWKCQRRKLGSLHIATLANAEALAVQLCQTGKLQAGEHLLRSILECSNPNGEYRKLESILTPRGETDDPILEKFIVIEDDEYGTEENPAELEGDSLSTLSLDSASTIESLTTPWSRWAAGRTPISIDIVLLSVRKNLGLALTGQLQFDEAQEILMEVVHSTNSLLGDSSYMSISCLEALAGCFFHQGHLGKALQACGTAYRRAVLSCGPDDELSLRLKARLENIIRRSSELETRQRGNKSQELRSISV